MLIHLFQLLLIHAPPKTTQLTPRPKRDWNGGRIDVGGGEKGWGF